MKGFFKTLLMGIVYLVTFPFMVVVLALYAIYLLFAFIYIALKSLIVWFKGGTPLGDLPEDVDAKRILMKKEQSEMAMQAAAQAMYNQQQAYAQQMNASQPFYNPNNQQQEISQPSINSFPEPKPMTPPTFTQQPYPQNTPNEVNTSEDLINNQEGENKDDSLTY